jgi:transcriptional/translational regulatory protein YebC/TACO1
MRNKATPSAAKAKVDKAKGDTATRFTQRIRIAHRDGDESKVQSLVKEAHKAGVSKVVTERALDRVRNRGALEDVLYEGTLPGGICCLIEALTDKKTRTAPEVRHALTEGGGVLGAPGAATWAFTRMGLLEFETADEDEREALMEQAMGLEGVEDIEDGDSDAEGGAVLRVWTTVSELTALRAALAGSASLVNDGLRFTPVSVLELDAETRATHDGVVHALRALDDVEAVWTNAAPS